MGKIGIVNLIFGLAHIVKGEVKLGIEVMDVDVVASLPL